MESPLIPRPGVKGPNGEDILMFSDQRIQQQLDGAAAALGQDQFVATLTYEKPTGEPGRIGLAAAYKLGDHWSMMGALGHSSQGTTLAGKIAWSHD